MKRYSSLAVYLHWIIAIAIFVMLVSGWSLHYELINSKQLTFQLFQWHKSIGIVIIGLVFLRIVWRLIKKPPATPEQLIDNERAIKFGHILLYILLIVMPLSGWVLVSTNPQGIPTIVFGLLDWLHLPLGEIAYQPAKLIHYYAAFVISAVVIGHIAMAIKHQSQGILLLQRMRATHLVKTGLVLSVATIGFLSINVFQVSPPAELKSISVDGESAGQNFIQFSGEHAGNPFNGVFTDWQLDTDIDIENQTMSRFNLTVSMATTSTGSSLYDQTLKETDWFDVENFPSANYQSSSAEFISETQVNVSGTFTLKETTIPLILSLSFDGKNISTDFTLKRQEINIGQDADPDADWVSEDIQVKAQVAL